MKSIDSFGSHSGSEPKFRNLQKKKPKNIKVSTEFTPMPFKYYLDNELHHLKFGKHCLLVD